MTAFDKAVFYGSDEADGFVLSLALIYNDFKQIEWTQQIVLGAAKPEVSPEAGQVFGMGIWASRFTFSLLHELFNALRLADKHRALASPAFTRTLAESPQVRDNWLELLRIAIGEDVDHSEAKALGAYNTMRNRATYHYGDAGALLDGYRRFFHELPASSFNEKAMMSVGLSLSETRFYFADAAAASLYDIGDDEGSALRDKTAEIRRLVSNTLAGIVVAYIATRTQDPNLPKVPAPKRERRRRQQQAQSGSA